jgi:hypothetical protein
MGERYEKVVRSGRGGSFGERVRPFCLAADPDTAVDAINTASPIKHVIIIVGENRSFDHLFATYVPQKNSEKILNLLSQRTARPARILPRQINTRS